MKRGWLPRLAAFALALGAGQAATPVQASGQTPFEVRAEQLPDLLNGKLKPERFFAPSFLAEIPPEQIALIARQLAAQNGKLKGVERIVRETDFNGEVELDYDRAIVRVQMVVAREAPNLAIGLLVTSVRPRNDSVAQLSKDFATLKGDVSVLVTRIDAPAEPLLSLNPGTQRAIGSTFKLWVLAEAARQVKAGERSWSDVIPLGPPSLQSGITQEWPTGAPMTMHSLATLMISLSDNTATDTLIRALGRHKLDGFVAGLLGESAERTLPVLTTIEAFALKMDAAADLRAAWQRGHRDERTRLLQGASAQLSLSAIDRTQFGGGPRFIGDIEWFASASDIAKTLNWLRLKGGSETLQILGVTVPLPQGEARRFATIGYKGGSETGVISMAFLIKSKSSQWFVVSGSWNDPVAAVDEKRFEALMARSVALVP